MEIETLIKHIDERQLAVADERDKLDDFIGELSDLKETCAEAWEALQAARDALSELV